MLVKSLTDGTLFLYLYIIESACLYYYLLDTIALNFSTKTDTGAETLIIR